MGFFRQKWWKFLSIPLLIFALAAGMLIPLSPGIVDVNPAEITRGTNITVDILTYHTHFKEEDPSLNVVLKNENNLICSSEITYISPTHINVEFGIPNDLRTDNKKDFYNLIIYNETDGTFFMRDAFAIEKTESDREISLQCTTILNMVKPAGITFPNREILYESIRNLFYHVPMWFTMIALLLFAFVSSIMYLSKGKEVYDLMAASASGVGLFFGLLGILTGMVWANYTWGAPWVNDPKLNGAALGMLIYLAYFVLRGSLPDRLKRAKVSAVYSVFAFMIYIVFIFVIPRLRDSLHPGSGGNPAFQTYDLDNTMRPVFYSGVLGFIILGFWITSLVSRYKILSDKQQES